MHPSSRKICTARSPNGVPCLEAVIPRSGLHCAQHHDERHEHYLQYKDASAVVKYLKERHRDLFARNIEPFQSPADLDRAIECVQEYLRIIDDEVRLREEHQSRFYHETIDQGHKDWISRLIAERKSINMLYKTLATRREQTKQEEESKVQARAMLRKQREVKRLLGRVETLPMKGEQAQMELKRARRGFIKKARTGEFGGDGITKTRTGEFG